MYGKDVKYRYENEQINVSNWLCELNLTENDILGIDLLLKKENEKCTIEDGSINYLSDININKHKIGMDSACIALGINDKADEIIKSQDEWQPKCALKTGMDGFFGEVIEGRRENELVFLLIYGYVNKDLFYNMSDVLDYLKTQFELKDLKLEKNVPFINHNELTVGAKVELNTCCINNDIGGTKIIRNKNYEDPLDGMQLIGNNLDGTISKTTLHSDDSTVDKPIVAEILSRTYDDETGYNFKGKIIDNNLVKEFKKIGTTGYKLEDFKKCGNKLYEEIKENRKNYDPSIVYFSEFDISKVIELPLEKDMEI